MSTMTCRVRSYPFNPFTTAPTLVRLTMPIPAARQQAMRLAAQTSARTGNEIFFVETLGADHQWINKDVYYRGHQYEIVGDRIPGLPVTDHQAIIKA